MLCPRLHAHHVRARECSKVSAKLRVRAPYPPSLSFSFALSLFLLFSLALLDVSRLAIAVCVREIAWAAMTHRGQKYPRLSDIHNKHERHRCLRPSIFRGYYPCAMASSIFVTRIDTSTYASAAEATRVSRGTRRFSEATTRSDIDIIPSVTDRTSTSCLLRCQKIARDNFKEIALSVITKK